MLVKNGQNGSSSSSFRRPHPRMMFSTSLQCSGRETIGRRRSETTEKRRDPKTRKRRTQRTRRRRRANSSVGRNSLRLAARNPSSLGSEEEGERGGGGGGGTAREDFVLTPSSKHEAKPSIFFLPFSVCRGFPLGGARQTDRPKQATMQALVEV